MKISVIIPCYNCERTIARVLDSIILQDYKDLEVIVCDDNSNDTTLAICHEYDEKLNIIYCNTIGRGYHCPNNTRLDGLNVSTGEWITFIDDDDAFVENAFNEFINAYNKESPSFTGPVPVIITTCSVINDETGEELEPVPPDQSNCLHGKFFNRQFLYDHDLLPLENIIMQEDILFMNRLRAYCISFNIPFILTKAVTYKWYLSNSTLSHWLDKYNIDVSYYYLDQTIHANVWPYLEAWEKYHIESTKETLLISISQILLGFYFTYMCLNYVQVNFSKMAIIYQLKIKEIIRQIIRIFNVTINYIIYLATSDVKVYDKVRGTTQVRHSAQFIESKSFDQFIMDIWNDTYTNEGHLTRMEALNE